MHDEAGMEDRLTKIEQDVGHIRATGMATSNSIERITTAIERLVVIETEHRQTRAALNRAFKEIDTNDGRISAIERRTETWDSTASGLRWLAGIVVTAAMALVWAKSIG